MPKVKKDKLVASHKEQIEPKPNTLWSDMDRLYNDFRKNLFNDLYWRSLPSNMLKAVEGRMTPPMDVADLGDKYEMHIDVPGVSKNDLNIEVTPYSIEISAEKEKIEDKKGKNWLKHERSSTSFSRYLEVPEEVKTENIEAEIKDGVLTIMLEKVEPKPRYKSKKVKIK